MMKISSQDLFIQHGSVWLAYLPLLHINLWYFCCHQEKLVYTGHTYTFWAVSDLPWEQYSAAMTFQQLFVDAAGHNYSAPYWMSEFGTGNVDSEKYQKIIRLLRENDADFAYWSVDGYK